MSVGPSTGTLVNAIPLAPPRVSLLSSVDVTEGGDRWMNGFDFQPEPCGPPTDPYWWACALGEGDPPDYTKDVPAPETLVETRPFDVWVGITCGNQRGQAEEVRARQALLAFQSHLIEQELWTGAVATAAGFPNDFLTNAPSEVLANALTPYVTALAELEQALATCQPGQVSVIHAQPRTVTVWAQNGLIVPDPNGRRLRTMLGTIVVPGSGYPGTGEGLASASADASFAYGTGMVRVWLGDIAIIDDFDRSVNTPTVRAERTVAVAWDECCHYSVQVDLDAAL